MMRLHRYALKVDYLIDINIPKKAKIIRRKELFHLENCHLISTQLAFGTL
jgi:NADH:ubiquinone oxidoreductase subunit D